jgi:hypothetical protein
LGKCKCKFAFSFSFSFGIIEPKVFFFCRQQFERANLEAMDESAEWRMKYDGEVERSRQFQDELLKVCFPLVGT